MFVKKKKKKKSMQLLKLLLVAIYSCSVAHAVAPISNPSLSYKGGPLIKAPEVFNVFYYQQGIITSNMNAYTSWLVKSSFISWCKYIL